MKLQSISPLCINFSAPVSSKIILLSDDFCTFKAILEGILLLKVPVKIFESGRCVARMGVHWANEILDKHNDIDADLLDLRTLCPLDKNAIFESVRKTGKVIVLHEDSLTGGIGGELVALIAQHCFESLDAPIARCGALDTPVPFDRNLEVQYMPKQRFETALLDLMAY